MEIKFTIKQVVAVGIGAALFVVIGMINIPTPVPKYKHPASVCGTSATFYYFGPIIGLFVGLIGHQSRTLLLVTVCGGLGLSLVGSLVLVVGLL